MTKRSLKIAKVRTDSSKSLHVVIIHVVHLQLLEISCQMRKNSPSHQPVHETVAMYQESDHFVG